jgi:outer membrane protein assembly factor BamE
MEARIYSVILATLLLGACTGKVLPSLPLGPLRPYQMEIQQGNVVTQEMIAKVQPGMSRAQVRFALGTPLLEDVFHKDRWDYVYLYQKDGKVTEHRRIVAIFKDDKLMRIDGDVIAAAPAPTPASKAEKPATAPPAAAPAPQQSVDKPAGSEASTPWPK